MKDSKNIKWIGLAKVGTPTDSDVLGGAKQGFTNVVGFAKTKSDFRNKTKNYLQSIQLKLIRLEDAEPLIERLRKHEVARDILKTANDVSPYSNSISLSTVHTY
jgi:hypothetical protein